MKLTPVAIDFEYNKSNELHMGLVSCALCVRGSEPEDYWLQDEEGREALKKRLLELREGHFLVCWNVSAEGRSLVALGLDPSKFKIYDAQIEYKMLLNWNDRLIVRDHISKTGKIVRYKKYSSPPKTLISATYVLLGILEDSKHKDKMRKLILSRKVFTEEEKQEILDYGRSDIKNLFDIVKKINGHYRSMFVADELRLLGDEMFYRGKIGALTSIIESRGYPIDYNFYVAVKDNAHKILDDCREDINSQFDWNIFKKKKDGSYGMEQKLIKEWIATSEYKDTWLKTPKESYALSDKAMEKLMLPKYEYPKGNVLAQVKRFNDLKKSFSGFLPKSASSTTGFFEDHLGSDGYVRPYLNAYGSQSARWQPKAVGYMFLKSPMFRSMVHPPKGKVIIGCDYASQEIFIAALNSKDQKMIDAYLSGDFYLAFGKDAGAIPQDGTKQTHGVERNRFKSTVLGISYGMGSISLAAKLTMDTGIKHTSEEAQKLIDLYFTTYPDYKKYIDKTLADYNKTRKMKLVDGWYMFGSNDNWRSVANCPIQGMGSCILRKVVERSHNANMKITMLLHDAAYFICDAEDLDHQVSQINYVMKKAFQDCYPDNKEKAKKIRLDFNAWGSDLVDGKLETEQNMEVKTQRNYFDPRGIPDYNLHLKKYVETN